MSFRLNAKHLFLTYPKCTESKENLLEYLKTKLDIKHAIVSKELHADNTPHLHVYLHLFKKCNIKCQSTLDFNGFHGNYTTCRNIEATKIYTKKDNDFIEFNEQKDDNIMDACKSLDQEEFLLWCVKKRIPRGYYDEAKRLCTRTFDVEESTEELPKGNHNPNLYL